jgi:hypothetical protein
MTPVKFVSVTRTIDPKTHIHYLDAICTEGFHWMAQMEHDTENWLCFSRVWYKDPKMPYDT